MKNDLSLSFSPEKMAAIDGAIAILQDELMPELQTLTAEQRREMLKMGDKTLAFVQKSAQYAEETPELVPSYMDMEEFKKDLTAAKQLRKIFLSLEKILNAVEDSYMIAGSEAFSGSLLFYHSAKGGVRANLPGAEEAYRDLRARWPGRPSKEAAEEEEETT